MKLFFGNVILLLEDRKLELSTLIRNILLPKRILWKVDQKIVSAALFTIEANIVATERIISLILEAPITIPLVLEELEEFYANCELQRLSLQKFIDWAGVGKSVKLAKRRMLIAESKETLTNNRRRVRNSVKYSVSKVLKAGSVKLIVKSEVEKPQLFYPEAFPLDYMEDYVSFLDSLRRRLGWDIKDGDEQ